MKKKYTDQFSYANLESCFCKLPGSLQFAPDLKKIGSILLLLIFLLQSGGTIFIYYLQQNSVQYEMSEKLKNAETQFKKSPFH